MEYNHREIEKRWQEEWAKNKTFAAVNDSKKPKYYVLDMFPYPSGAGLHVGHPLGYIATDIVARYKRHRGFNVLHPMGYDSFGLPAEQYAIQTGQHPALTTEQNIKRYREQLDKIGFSFDWDREVRTSDPNYYKWTQWIFLQLFNSWYNPRTNKAEALDTLVNVFETEGFKGCDHDILTGDIEKDLKGFTADEWKKFDEKKRSEILMNFRLAYLGEAYVNWCAALGTVLANDEVKDGVSERGGHPVERKLMKQWSMRITAYAQRLLDDLDGLDWSESLKEAQRNWIGRSQGCSIQFEIENLKLKIEVFTTRPDTLFGVSYLTLAPEHELVEKITTAEQKAKVDAYVAYAKNRSERERQADVKKITGEFTGAYALHPFTGDKIPVWVGDYVLAGYGTGAVMAVPAHDARDHAFAQHFGLPLKQVIETPEGWDLNKEAYEEKKGKVIESAFLNGLDVLEAIQTCTAKIEEKGCGKGQVNYRLRDAVFGRQRYWGEPIPVYYKEGIPHAIPMDKLPLVLPEVDKYLPTAEGEPPLARSGKWNWDEAKGEVVETGKGLPLENTTMPGWAGSSWYFLRYMDAHNEREFVGKAAADYWENADLYIGGAEHATGHLLYVRFWTKFLKDRGFIKVDEPAKKLINQGMIGGNSMIATIIYYKQEGTKDEDIIHYMLPSEAIVEDKTNQISRLHFPVEYTQFDAGKYFISEEGLQKTKEEYPHTKNYFIYKKGDALPANIKIDESKLKEGSVVFDSQHDKMSKRWYNVVNPDRLCEKFGGDSLRLYEMFLGPLTEHKPWDTKGIEGVYRFLRKFWRLFYDQDGNWMVNNEEPNKAELKALHKAIKRVTEDIERYSFNTVVSTFMIAVNELTELKCSKKQILEPLVVLLSPYAPHITEELWKLLGHNEGCAYAQWPVLDESHLVEDSFAYPIQFNGKMRFNLEMSLSLDAAAIEKFVLENEETQKFLEGKTPKKVIVVPKRIVNIVV